MDKIWIIIKREYLNIVRKKFFLIATFLVPLGFAAIFGIQILAAKFVEKESYTVLVEAEAMPEITGRLTKGDIVSFENTNLSKDSLRARVEKNKDEIYLTISESILEKKNGTAVLIASKNPSQQAIQEIRSKLKDAIQDYKNEKANITKEQLAATDFDLDVETRKVQGGEEKETNIALATGIGFGVSFLMYMLMGIYGSILMQGVIEEKSNRIVEIIVSSIDPFKLLMGKTLAIASVGITQFLMWMILSGVVMTVLAPFAAGMDPQSVQQPGMEVQMDEEGMQAIVYEIQNFDWTILWYFPLYFLGGFFLYGSLFAAAGAAVDNIQDAQQFTLPVTLPMILPMLFLLNIIQNPNGVFAISLSMIPFFSPMTMLVRMALTDVAWYEIVLSILILIGSFLGCIWLAARIYRTGILMYGKKPTFKEIFRWVRYSRN
ncbi:MAG: ABC transporter permease [Bacteroidetes bacterium]|nr:ABC transporter permease [Bacteroidota bacterium]